VVCLELFIMVENKYADITITRFFTGRRESLKLGGA